MHVRNWLSYFKYKKPCQPWTILVRRSALYRELVHLGGIEHSVSSSVPP